MKNTKGYIVWSTSTNPKFFPTYEEAWRYAEDRYKETGEVALVERLI